MRDKIKELLDNRGWSLYKLAKESGVSASTLHDFLISGKIRKLGIDKLTKICGSLGIPFQYLLDEENNETNLKEQQYNFIPDENISMVARAGQYMTQEQ